MRSLAKIIVYMVRDELALHRMGESTVSRPRVVLRGIRMGVWAWRWAQPRHSRFALPESRVNVKDW